MRFDKGRIEVGNLHERKNDRACWLSKTPEETFAAMEYLRRMNFGYDEDSPRLQRLLEGVERKRGSIFNKRAAGRHKDLDDLENPE